MTTTVEPIRAEDYIGYADSLTYKTCRAFGCINDVNDLRSCSYLGLLDAVAKFDPAKNVAFKQFAYVKIYGAIVDGMRSLYAGSKKSVAFKKRLEELSSKLGTEDSEILAAELGMSLDEFHKNKGDLNKMCRANFSDLSPATSDEESTGDFSFLSDHTMVEPDGDALILMNEIWTYLKANYSDRDFLIMKSIYKDELTMSDTGKLVHLTECRVSQIHQKIVGELRRRLFKIQGKK